jgi:hypothetical protein
MHMLPAALRRSFNVTSASARTTASVQHTHPQPVRQTQHAFFRRSISLALLIDVANAAEVQAAVQMRSLDAAVIDADLLPHVFAVHLAANAALHHAATLPKLRTGGGLHTELVYCLGASRNVGEGLRVLGPKATSTRLLVAAFDADEAALLALATGAVKGTLMPAGSIDEVLGAAGALPGAAAAAQIAHYKISAEELAVGSIGDAIVARIAGMDIGGG